MKEVRLVVATRFSVLPAKGKEMRRYLAAVKAAAMDNRKGRLPEYHAKTISNAPKSKQCVLAFQDMESCC